MNLLWNIDITILSFFSSIASNFFIDNMMIFFTTIGNIAFIWIIITLIMLSRKNHRKTAFTIIIALLFSLVFVNLGIKPLIQRPRPFQEFSNIELKIKKPMEYSFPSGHSSSSFAAALAIIFTAKRKRLPFALLALAVIIAFSRIYLNVHFFSDVIGGMIVGCACAFFAAITGTWIIKKIPKQISQNFFPTAETDIKNN